MARAKTNIAQMANTTHPGQSVKCSPPRKHSTMNQQNIIIIGKYRIVPLNSKSWRRLSTAARKRRPGKIMPAISDATTAVRFITPTPKYLTEPMSVSVGITTARYSSLFDRPYDLNQPSDAISEEYIARSNSIQLLIFLILSGYSLHSFLTLHLHRFSTSRFAWSSFPDFARLLINLDFTSSIVTTGPSVASYSTRYRRFHQSESCSFQLPHRPTAVIVCKVQL